MSSYLFANQLRIHYLTWNRDGERRPIVLHHGLASNAHIWDLTAPYLAQAGHPVYALEARGHGLSDKPDDGYDFTSLTDDLAAFLDACRLERPLLVGHSWGAAVALVYATRFPAGPHAIAGLGLLDGGLVQMNDSQRDWDTLRTRLTPPALSGMPLSEFRRKLIEWNADWNPPAGALEAYLHSFDVDDDERIAPRLTLAHHMAILESMWGLKTSELHPRLLCPTLAIVARSDANRHADEQAFAAAKEAALGRLKALDPRNRAIVLLNAIHDIPLQHPQVLAEAIIDFSDSIELV